METFSKAQPAPRIGSLDLSILQLASGAPASIMGKEFIARSIPAQFVA